MLSVVEAEEKIRKEATGYFVAVKPEKPASGKRRSLDDMRRLSEQIKKTRTGESD